MPADQPDIIQAILKDSDYQLDLFQEAEIAALRERIQLKTGHHAVRPAP